MLDKINFTEAMKHTLSQVESQGLHKIAGHLYGLDEVTLPKVAGHLCAKLYANHRKREKIASGISALKKLASSGDVKL